MLESEAKAARADIQLFESEHSQSDVLPAEPCHSCAVHGHSQACVIREIFL